MRKSITLLSVCFMTAMSLAGCGSTNAPTDAATQENGEEKSDKIPVEEYELQGIDKKYYSLSADEAEKLDREGTLYYAANGLAFLEEVEDGYWLISYSVFE